MPFGEQIPIALRGLGQIDPEHAAGDLPSEQYVPTDLEDLVQLAVAGAIDEREAREVSGDASPARRILCSL